VALRNVLLAVLAPALLLAPLASCGGDGDDRAPGTPGSSSSGSAARDLPSLVLITVDTLRADHLGAYGYFRDTSPTIDELARGSLVFDRCYAPIPRTAPSHTSLFTGVYPYEHGITNNVGRQLAAEIRRGDEERPEARLKTFPTWLKEAGYHTGGFVSATPLKKETGIAVGFDRYTQPDDHRRSAEATNRDVFAWLAEVQEPFFLWVHYFDPHGPFDETLPVPESFQRLFASGEDDGVEAYLRERAFAERVSNKNYDEASVRHLVDTYDGAIRYLDQQLASLFAELRHLGHWDDTFLVLTSDHGEGLGQHGFAGHGLVWNEQLNVPLLMRGPGISAGRVDTTLSTIDVLPTFLGRLGRPVVDVRFLTTARGRDVLAESFEPRPVFAMSPEGQAEYGWIGERWKLLLREGGDLELFDLVRDPHELTDLSETEAERVAELRRGLEEAIAEQQAKGELYGAGEVVETTDPRHLEELKALGYLGDDDDH